MVAALNNAVDCAKLLLTRAGSVLDLDTTDDNGWTALHYTANTRRHAVVQLLLDAGADPTICNNYGDMPLVFARLRGHQPSIALLQAALAEPQRPRLLLKARALCDANSRPDAPIPAYLQGRVTQGQPLPQVQINDDAQDDDDDDLDEQYEAEELDACVRFALGLEGHGGWAGAEHEGATMRTEGLFPELFIELCELLVPRWDRKNL